MEYKFCPKTGIHYLIQKQETHQNWVVLVHGLFGSLDNLSVLRKSLCEHYNVIAIDLPDHGKSAPSEEFCFQLVASKLKLLFESLNIPQVIYIGHSLGGKIGMQLALDTPQLINKLVVADIAPVAYSRRHDQVFAGLQAIDLKELTNRQQANEILLQHIDHQPTAQFLVKSLYRDDDNWAWRFNLPLIIRDYPNIIRGLESDNRFDGPVLFIKGELSDYILPEHRNAIVKLFPNSKAKIIQGAGHWLHAEKPQVLSAMVGRFLREQASSPID